VTYVGVDCNINTTLPMKRENGQGNIGEILYYLEK
jgi:hypothetical protein